MAEVGEWKTRGVLINDFLKKDFFDELKKIEPNLNAVSLVFISDIKDEKGNTTLKPVLLGHESNEEIKNKILHLKSPDEELQNKILKLLEKLGAK